MNNLHYTLKGQLRTKNGKNVCWRESYAENDGASPAWKFVSGEEEGRLKVFRSRESRDAFSRHVASLVPTVDPGPGSWPGPNNDSSTGGNSPCKTDWKFGCGSFSSCEGVQAGVQCLEYSFVVSCSTLASNQAQPLLIWWRRDLVPSSPYQQGLGLVRG